jgi:hypothetical protein
MMKKTVISLLALTLVAWTFSPTTRAPEPVRARMDADAVADSLVQNWIDALGGLETYWPLKAARYTLTTEIYDTESGRLRRTRPRYVTIARTDAGELARIERWEGNDFIVQGWDGTTSWATMNGEPLAEGDMDYDQVAYVSGDVNYWISLPFKLQDPGVNLHYQGVQDDGRHLMVVTFGEGVGLHDGDTWQYWFEDGTTWPVELAYREEGRTNYSHLRFEDIRTVDGYIFVGRRVHFNGSGMLTKVLFSHDFEFNPKVDFSIFAKP